MGIWGKILQGEEEHLIGWPGFVPCPPMNHQGQGSVSDRPSGLCGEETDGPKGKRNGFS